MDLSRRDAIQRLSQIAGGVLSAPLLSALASGCRAEPRSPEWTPEVLTMDQVELLEALVDVIVPATDTPGAREAGVVVFIDTVLSSWLDPEDRDRFLAGLAEIDTAAQASQGNAFRSLEPDRQLAFLTQLDADASSAGGAGSGPPPFFAGLKQLTLVGYYTSEVGATQELQWMAVPGRYDGDLPLEEVGRTWA